MGHPDMPSELNVSNRLLMFSPEIGPGGCLYLEFADFCRLNEISSHCLVGGGLIFGGCCQRGGMLAFGGLGWARVSKRPAHSWRKQQRQCVLAARPRYRPLFRVRGVTCVRRRQGAPAPGGYGVSRATAAQ